MSEVLELMLKATTTICRARSLRDRPEVSPLEQLEKGVELMNKAIALDPENIENRSFRLRYMLGITRDSPKDYLDIFREDVKFFQNCFNSLSNEEKSSFLTTYGEYLIFIGNTNEAIEVLTDVINNYKETAAYFQTKVLLDTIVD